MRPHIAVVALAMFDDDDNVAAAMKHGAAGYLLKEPVRTRSAGGARRARGRGDL